MKILKLNFSNLNSLLGSWEIDFTDSAFERSGIFVVSGPTGSGKSTILDALCLAMFGQTPRLGRITSGSNEIMSKQAGSCCAEAVFEAGAQIYVCRWSQHRAYGKSGERLQAPKHILINAGGTVIEDKRELTAKAVERITGLNFSRFTKSAVLAQGRFSSFLMCGFEERAKILEQISNTEVYGRISALVHKRSAAEKAALEELCAGASANQPLSELEESELKEKYEAALKKKKECENSLFELRRAEILLEKAEDIKKKQVKLENNKQICMDKLNAFMPYRSLLDKADRAEAAEKTYIEYVNIQNELKEAEDDWNKYSKELEAVYPLHKNLLSELADREKLYEAVSVNLENMKPVFSKVRVLDAEIADILLKLNLKKNKADEIEAELKSYNLRKDECQKKLYNEAKKLSKCELYLNAHASYSELSILICGLEERIRSLEESIKRIKRRKDNSQELKKDLYYSRLEKDNYINQIAISRSHQDKITLKTEEKKRGISQLLSGRTRKELELDRDGLELKIANISLAVSLEEMRKGLREGIPCPLCGSCQHPYSDNASEAADYKSRLSQIEDQINILDKLEEDLKILNLEYSESEHCIEKDTVCFEAAEAKYQQYAEALAGAERELELEIIFFEDLCSRVKEDFISKNETFSGCGDWEVLSFEDKLSCFEVRLKRMKLKYDEWKKYKAEAEESRKIIEELNGFFSVLNIEELACCRMQEEIKSEISQLRGLWNLKRDERVNLLENKDVCCEESELKSAAEHLENSISVLRADFEKTQHQLEEIRMKRRETGAKLDDLRVKIKDLKTQFEEKMAEAGFKDNNSFMKARMNDNQRSILHKKYDKLVKDLEKAQISERECRSLLNELLSDISEKRSLGEVKEQLAAELEEGKSLAVLSDELLRKITDNDHLKACCAELRSEIALQRKKSSVWEALDRLIGSEDGVKYRTFVQNLTFKFIVEHANEHLKIMSERYALACGSQPLELNVIDLHQSGAVRTVKNLSGGESFIISLALALGLAGTVGKNICIGSLFLDEGFGTLDEKSLQYALNALSCLKAKGRLVGVISHAEALKDKIPVHIEIIPEVTGCSSICGPGCRKL